MCDLAETDRVREREKGTETGQVNESVSVIPQYKEMMAGNAEHATSLILVLAHSMVPLQPRWSATTNWQGSATVTLGPVSCIGYNLARFADGACMTCMVVLHAVE